LQKLPEYTNLGWQHPMWELLRIYRSMGGALRQRDAWLDALLKDHACTFPGDEAPPVSVEKGTADSLGDYIDASEKQFGECFSRLRREDEATAYCRQLGVELTRTRTKSKDHHQSPKALVGSVTFTAAELCQAHGVGIDPNPQNRCVWTDSGRLHVSARRLDGAIPSLVNPTMVWEIKEYWGGTGGGSKMSDAVYECQLVGREIREFEDSGHTSVVHVVFIDGEIQWSTRKSDFARFIDLANQGLIDNLVIGREVEADWSLILEAHLQSRSSGVLD